MEISERRKLISTAYSQNFRNLLGQTITQSPDHTMRSTSHFGCFIDATINVQRSPATLYLLIYRMVFSCTTVRSWINTVARAYGIPHDPNLLDCNCAINKCVLLIQMTDLLHLQRPIEQCAMAFDGSSLATQFHQSVLVATLRSDWLSLNLVKSPSKRIVFWSELDIIPLSAIMSE